MNTNHLICKNTVNKRCASYRLKLYTKVYNLICQKSNHMEIRAIYDYLNELSRCEWRDNAIVNGIRYNGIDITQGVETYQKHLEAMQSEAEEAILSLAASCQSKVLNAIHRKAKEASEQDYDIITPLAVEALKAEFPIPRSETVRAEIELGEFVMSMHSLQLFYLDKLLTFLNCLLEDSTTVEATQPEPEAKRVATALELYCTGSLNLFNFPTNVDLNSRVVCIVLKGLGENLRKIAMHITNDFVTSAVNTNFHSGIATWCYFDEFHILLRDALTASYFVAVWKMLRKKGCVPSALTQNVKDLLASREIEAILDNTDFMILLSQAQSDRAILAKQIGISEHQLSYITHANSGEGLLFYGSTTIPFVDRFPKGEIYNLLTTRPEDLRNEPGA